jgi:Flp pilus assembly protein TadG
MAQFTHIFDQVAKFWNNQKGNTAIIYALSAIPTLLAVGAGVDYARFASATVHIQSALDNAALTGAMKGKISDTERIALAEASFKANMEVGAASGLGALPSFTIVDKVFIAKASATVPTALMHLAGIGDMTTLGEAQVGISNEKKAEIVLVLDYSGSMADMSGGQVKYKAMSAAAGKLVNDLAASNPENIKIGLVPFSHHVYTSLPASYVQTKKIGTWTGCTQDRPYPDNLTSNTPDGTETSKWNQPTAPEHAGWGCGGYAPRQLMIQPLTDKFKMITHQLNKMEPYAWTHIALGVEFGFHVLSPNAPYTGGVEFGDPDTKKYMVVLTDGMQTEPAFGPGGVRDVAQGESNLAALCNNIKTKDITVITVAFDLDDSDTRKRLSNCASGAGNAMVADDSTDLSLAFESIKTAIASEIYLRK